MKRSLIIILLLCIAAPLTAQNRSDGPGVGIIVGEPTGLSFRYKNFPVMGFAWSFHDDSVGIFCDYWVLNKEFRSPIDWYVGAGVKYVHGKEYHDNPRNQPDHVTEEDWLGVRVPVGIQYFPDSQVELFAEVVPGIYLYPETDFLFDIGVGARFFFF